MCPGMPRGLLAAALLLACLGAAQSEAEGGSGRRRLQTAYAPWLSPDALQRGLQQAGSSAALRSFALKLITGA